MEIPGIDGVFEALQLHIHILSEHTIDNELFDFELHIVHQLVNGTGFGDNGGQNSFAVFGFILQVDDSFRFRPNRRFQSLLNGWRDNQWAQMVTCNQTGVGGPVTNQIMRVVDNAMAQDFGANLYDFVPDKNFFHYSGGLTTPPCTEAVWWNLADEPVKISPWQGRLMTSIILNYMDESCELGRTLADPVDGNTARPPVPTGDRLVSRYCSEAE